MNGYRMRTDVSWAQTYGELERQFELWGVRDYEVKSLGKNDKSGYQPADTRRVTVRWTSRGGQEHTLTLADQDRAVDNLRVIRLAIEAVRLNELRPDAPLEVAEASYKALARLKHPDQPGGSTEAMKELNEAIEQLRGGQTALGA